MKKTIALLAIGAVAISASAQEREFLPPTMGWSSWNTYGANISETIIKKQADAMIDKGFFEAGYNYINIDDGYFANRDENGRLIIHPTRFPNGMKPVVDYIHSKGLKAGCYSDGGHNTCASKWGGETGGVGAGMYEHDIEDCEMYFNEFGFDFIKVDFCGGVYFHNDEELNLDAKERYTAIANAIKATGRTDVVFNVCRWAYPGTWISDIADSWRTTGDINASWGSVRDIIKENLYLSAYCGGGHYNDMDMLEVGRGLTRNEDITHFGMWCIMSSPLLIGCDMSTVTTAGRVIMTNSELIALNQDPLGLQAYVAAKDGEVYILVKDVQTRYGKTRAVAFFNPSDEEQEATIEFEALDLAGNVKIRDLVAHEDLDDAEDWYTVDVPKHGSKFYLFTADQRLERKVYEAETAFLPAYQELESNQAKETAVYCEKAVFSGGAGAGWLGKRASNDLQWRDVYVFEDGEYDIEIAYATGETRSMIMTVNDGQKKTFSCNSGSFDKVGTVTHRITLNKGNNVIRLYSNSGWMPDIDCMTLTRITPSGIDAVEADPASDAPVFDLQGRQVSPAGTANLPAGIYVQSGRKIRID